MNAVPVVLIHGFGRSRLAMLPLARGLRRAGYRPINVGYFANRQPVEEIAARLAEQLLKRLEPIPAEQPVHFVTHSLGGILARAYLAQHPRAGTRLVQLAPPNQGAAIAERISRWPLVGSFPGATLQDLGVGEDGSPRLDLPALNEVEVGVIAGGKGGPGKGYGPLFEDDSDGIVRVVETYLPEAQDWILLPRLHTFIMNGQATRENVVAFLESGRFLPQASRLERDQSTCEVRVVQET